MSGVMETCPVFLDEAKEFIRRYHRHHLPPLGGRASVGISLDGELVGVAIVGRPVARHLDNGNTAEIIRTCTTDVKNAPSKVLAAGIRLALSLGYKRVVTYTGKSESGASLRAAGMRVVAEVPAQSWNKPGRARVDKHKIEPRFRWEPAQ